MTADADDVTVHSLQDGELVSTYDCVLSASSHACSKDGVEEFRTQSDPGWIEFPLPDGDVVYEPSSGWWVVQGDVVVPVDEHAAQQADGAVPYDAFVGIVTDGGGPLNPLGMPWEFLGGAVAVVAIAVTSAVLSRRNRRRSMRPSST